MVLTPRDLINDNLQLVSLPEIVTRINEMVDDPNCSAADIGELISQDAALSARLLKIVNSSLYNFPSRIETISLAITIVGTRQLRDMVLATAVTGRFRRIPEGLVSPDLFWHHNLACATACRVIAQQLGVSHTERYFVAGLLHDIGKLVMYLAQPELSRQVLALAESQETALENIEQHAFGFSHTDVGAELLRHWQLPESLIEPTAWHHSPAGATTYQPETAAVHLGNAIANTLESPISADDDRPVDQAVWGMLRLEPADLDALLAETGRQLGSVLELLYYAEAA
jgi:putative nucleotidyltransferase with HDIG domain